MINEIRAIPGIAEISGGNEIVSLSERMMHAYAKSTVSAVESKAEVMRALESPSVTSPEILQQIQEQVADDSLKISMVSTVTRKLTSTVEALLRS